MSPVAPYLHASNRRTADVCAVLVAPGRRREGCSVTETDAVERKPLHSASSKHPPGAHGDKKVLYAAAVGLRFCLLFLSCHKVYFFHS